MDVQCLQQKTQTLEYDAVAGLPDVGRKTLVVTVLLPKVPVHDVNDVTQASANGRGLEDVDERPGRVGHVYLGLVTPDGFGTEHSLLRDMFNKKPGSLDADLPAPHLPRGQNHSVQKYLLG